MAAISEVQYVSISQTATTTLVAAQAAGIKVRVVEVCLVNTTAQTVTFKSGAAGTAITGAMALGANGVLVLPHSPAGWFETAAATLLELSQSGATQLSGAIGWVAATN